jgi:hypothetical protein
MPLVLQTSCAPGRERPRVVPVEGDVPFGDAFGIMRSWRAALSPSLLIKSQLHSRLCDDGSWRHPPALPRRLFLASGAGCWLTPRAAHRRWRGYGGIALIHKVIAPSWRPQTCATALDGRAGRICTGTPSRGPGSQPGASAVSPQLVWWPRLALPQRPPACRAGALLLSYGVVGLPGRASSFPLAPRRSSALRPRRYELRVPLSTPARYGHASWICPSDLPVMSGALCLAELSRESGAPCRCRPGTSCLRDRRPRC